MMLSYLISTTTGDTDKKEIIHDPKTKLKIKVFDLLCSQFRPRKGEVRYFVTAGNETLAFETDGYKKHQTLLILHMISWYCVYLGLMEAQIHANCPS